MPRLATARNLAVYALLALAAACNQADDDAGYSAGILEYVPADTPYLFASPGPVPDDVYEKIEPKMDRLLAAYRDVIRFSLREGLEDRELDSEESEIEAERVVAVVDRLVGMFSSEGMVQAGLDRDSAVALYGAGLLPVLRVELADTAAFERTLAELESEAGTDMQRASLDDVTYRYAGDENARVLVAVQDDHMVATLVPTSLGEDGLRSVLGIAKPARSVAASGELAQLAERYGYTSFGAGYVDFRRIAAVFLDEQSGVNAEVLALADYDHTRLSDVCREEIRGMAAIAPRLVTGYTEYSAERMVSNTVLELREDIAKGLSALTAPVPGLGRDQGGMVSFGMSIDLAAARDFYSSRLDAIEATPYKCELFADLQSGVAQGRAVLEQPVPPIVYGFRGFLAVVDEVTGLDVANKQPPTSIDMRFLLASENAPGLVAMGSMFSPELAMLNLQADGKAVRFESPQLQPPVEEAWLAMTDSAISMAVGKNGEKQATTLLEQPAGSPPPLFSMHMDAGRYYAFIGDAVAMEQDGEDVSPEIGAAVKELMLALGDLIERVSVSVLLTERGMEIPAVTTLAD